MALYFVTLTTSSTLHKCFNLPIHPTIHIRSTKITQIIQKHFSPEYILAVFKELLSKPVAVE